MRSEIDNHPRILVCGDQAVAVEYGTAISPELNDRVLALDADLANEPLPGLRETVPTYRSLLVHYDPARIGFTEISAALLARAARVVRSTRAPRRWSVPVVYGGEFGIDLEDVARRTDMTPAEVVALHAAGDYRVYMIGFTPGFAYLGGLDERLALPRRDDPRLETPAGTISIGGAQAAVQCLAGPSGWHLIGRTPVRTYHPGRDPVFLMDPGDHVVFEPVPASEWEPLDRAAAAGEPVARLLSP
jgi:KipI family sensor histidine kinase inhibitor